MKTFSDKTRKKATGYYIAALSNQNIAFSRMIDSDYNSDDVSSYDFRRYKTELLLKKYPFLKDHVFEKQ